MKNNETLKANIILVIIEDTNSICGITYLNAGSIVKVAYDSEDYKSSVRVYRNLNEELDKEKKEHDIRMKNLIKDLVNTKKKLLEDLNDIDNLEVELND